MALVDDLVKLAKRVAASRKVPLSRLGREIVGDNKFFDRLEAGGDCGTRTYQRVKDALTDQLPAGKPGGADGPAEDEAA